MLHLVGLDAAADQRVGGFSLGMRQRLAIAGALLGDPEVLMLDEPANGLDPDGIRWLRTMLTGFADAGGTVFVSSHFIAELATFAHDLVVVGNGRLITAEPLADDPRPRPLPQPRGHPPRPHPRRRPLRRRLIPITHTDTRKDLP